MVLERAHSILKDEGMIAKRRQKISNSCDRVDWSPVKQVLTALEIAQHLSYRKRYLELERDVAWQ